MELKVFKNGTKEIKKLKCKKTKSGKYRSWSLYLCFCGEQFERRRDKVKDTSSCGCKSGNKCHGLSGKKIYRIWVGIKRRCFDCNQICYNRYKDLGMEDEWVNNPVSFIDYVSNLENFDENNIGIGANNISLDRIDSEKGYFKGNLRWATRIVQARNQRLPKNNTSGYLGVSSLVNGKFSANISINYKNTNIGVFNTPEEAYEARQKYIKENNLEYYN